MPTIARPQAVEKLIQEVRGMRPDYLTDFHNELFPQEPISESSPAEGRDVVRQKILDYLRQGVEVEEILDLWNVAFPGALKVDYDDETDTIRYSSESEAVRQTD